MESPSVRPVQWPIYSTLKAFTEGPAIGSGQNDQEGANTIDDHFVYQHSAESKVRSISKKTAPPLSHLSSPSLMLSEKRRSWKSKDKLTQKQNCSSYLVIHFVLSAGIIILHIFFACYFEDV